MPHHWTLGRLSPLVEESFRDRKSLRRYVSKIVKSAISQNQKKRWTMLRLKYLFKSKSTNL